MLKPRYILIIFIIFFVSITVAGFAIDQHFIRSAASDITSYVQTAADCALEAVTLSDEFFTNTAQNGYSSAIGSLGGGEAAASRDNKLLVDIGDGKGLVAKNPFQLTYNTNNVTNTYAAMFANNTRFMSWAKNIFNVQMTSPEVWVASGTKKAKIPELCTMGTKMFANKIKDFTSDLYGTLACQGMTQGSSSLQDTFVYNMLEPYDYWEYRRETSISGTSGKHLVYFLTPVSLGYTYIDKYTLDILFRANLDLLMRAKYINNGKLSSAYSAVIDQTYYPDSTEIGSDWTNTVVNNGQFYYVRGKLQKSSKSDACGAYAYNFGTQPDIQYVYITLTPQDRNYLINKTACSSSLWLTNNNINKINNTLAQAINPTVTLQSLAKNYTGTGNYDIVLAKVTFYAEFIIPYQTSPMRGMAEHFGCETSNAGAKAKYSESDLNCITIFPDTHIIGTQMGNNAAMAVGSAASGAAGTGSMLSSNAPYIYTTYYAVVD